MAESKFDEQFKAFLKRAGEDLKRMGEDIRTEAQRLIQQVQDPQTQERMRVKAREVGTWARQAASDVADLVEKGAQKAEQAFRDFAYKRQASGRSEPAQPAARPAAPRAAASTPKKPAAKTVGAKKRPAAGAPKKKTAGTAAKKKTIGRKKPGQTG